MTPSQFMARPAGIVAFDLAVMAAADQELESAIRQAFQRSNDGRDFGINAILGVLNIIAGRR